MVFSAVSGISNGPVKAAVAPSPAVQAIVAMKVGDNSNVAEYVEDYFSDVPVMINIAYCESRDRQYNSQGDVFRGAVNNQDVGVMQINEHYHLDEAQQDNYNLYSVEGNTAYARKLYEKFGTAPWNSSKPCWGKMSTTNPGPANANQVAQANVN